MNSEVWNYVGNRFTDMGYVYGIAIMASLLAVGYILNYMTRHYSKESKVGVTVIHVFILSFLLVIYLFGSISMERTNLENDLFSDDFYGEDSVQKDRV